MMESDTCKPEAEEIRSTVRLPQGARLRDASDTKPIEKKSEGRPAQHAAYRVQAIPLSQEWMPPGWTG